MICVCSDKLYFSWLILLHAVVCLLSAAVSVLVALSRGQNKKCYLFGKINQSALPCDYMIFTFTVIAVWSFLSMVCNALCSCWRRLTLSLRMEMVLAVMVCLVSFGSSIALTVGFSQWCQWLTKTEVSVSALTGCKNAAEEYDQSFNITDMEAFYYLNSGAQGCGWITWFLCTVLIFMYLRCCCCQLAKTGPNEGEPNEKHALIHQ